MFKRKYTCCLLSLVLYVVGYAQNDTSLRSQLNRLITPFHAAVGLSVQHLENGDTLTVRNSEPFPMQSVYKVPLALAVLHEVDKGRFTLNQRVHITQQELLPNTWSPLARLYPNGNIDMSIAELLHYTVAKSDNNTCDILFKLMGGTAVVDAYMHQLGYTQLSIKATEAEIASGKDSVAELNGCYPAEMSRLLAHFFAGAYVSDSSHRFLMRQLIESENSANRIKGLLPATATVAHKTGTGNRIVNDVGVVTLPNGNHIALSVFVKKSSETFEDTEQLIAKLAKTVYAYYAGYQRVSGKLDQLLNETIPHPFNGVVLIAERGKPVYTHSKGYARIRKKVPLKADHQFAIGSISKQFTAVLVLRALEKGQLQLHVPVKTYLPELTMEWAKQVTVHHLLTHMHGIVALDQPAAFEAGTQFDYAMANTGYALLSQIVERVSGTSFEQLSTQLFASCGMTHTFHPANKKYTRLVMGYTEGADGRLTEETRSLENDPAAGGFISTAGDLVTWNQWLHQGLLLKRETYTLMVTPKEGAVRQHPLWGTVTYGYGITVKQEGCLQVGQTGFAPGFASMDFYFPATQTSVIVLENVAYNTFDLKQTFYHHRKLLQLILTK